MRWSVVRIVGAGAAPLARRVRWLFAVFAVLVAGLTAAAVAAAPAALWPHRAAALVVLTALAGWAWLQYRVDRLPPWAEPIPAVGVLASAWLLGNPRYVSGLMFVLLYGRALHGPAERVWAAAAAYLLAYEAAAVVTAAEGHGAVHSVTMGLGIVFSTGVMWLVGDVVRAQERASTREATLARAATQLQRAADHSTVYDVAVAAALELVGDVPGASVSLWRGDSRTVRIGGTGGDVPDDIPAEVALETVPPTLRAALLAGQPFALDRAASAALERAVGVAPRNDSILIAPFAHGDTFSGALAVGSTRALPEEIVGSLGRLAADVGLSLDRADSNALLAHVVDGSADATVLLDDGFTILLASAAVSRLVGSPPQDLVGRSAAELFGAATDLPQLMEAAASCAEMRDPEVVVVRHLDGTARAVELAVRRFEDTRRRGWVLNLRDVTRRVEMEHALRESEERFRSLAESVTEGMYRMVLHPRARFEYVNPAMEELTGFPAQRFLDDPATTLRHVHGDDRHLIELTRTDPAAVRWPVEVRWHHPQRGWRWVSFREKVVFDTDGTPLSSMGIVSDVTARKEQEAALREALEAQERAVAELQRVDTMKTTFLQAVSHELRTPLTAIVGYAQTLQLGRARLDDATSQQLLERLTANAERLNRLLTDLLDLDRMATGVVVPSRRPVDVADLCRRVLEHVDVGEHLVTCTPARVVADVDGPKVERIVENLVRNALKYTEPGAAIEVEVEASDDPVGVVLTVADRGPGLPEPLREDIFQPFVQGPQSAGSAKPGTGIGLALVARFAELHGGRAWYEAREGGGSRFRVLLPGGRGGDPEPAPAAEAGSAVR